MSQNSRWEFQSRVHTNVPGCFACKPPQVDSPFYLADREVSPIDVDLRHKHDRALTLGHVFGRRASYLFDDEQKVAGESNYDYWHSGSSDGKAVVNVLSLQQFPVPETSHSRSPGGNGTSLGSGLRPFPVTTLSMI